MAKLKDGDKAPSFKLPNQDGKEISLGQFSGQWVVLYFYPKDMTPGCTQEAIDFTESITQLKKNKTVVIGVSKDSVASHRKFIDKYNIDFDLISDEDLVACKSYGVYKKKKLYGREYMGIERSTFVINPQGKIAKIYPKVKVKGHAEEILDFIQENK